MYFYDLLTHIQTINQGFFFPTISRILTRPAVSRNTILSLLTLRCCFKSCLFNLEMKLLPRESLRFYGPVKALTQVSNLIYANTMLTEAEISSHSVLGNLLTIGTDDPLHAITH